METNEKRVVSIGNNVTIEHEKCDYSYGQGYKAGERSGYVGAGYYFTNNGYGHGTLQRPSKLTLTVNIGGELVEVLNFYSSLILQV